MASVALIGPDGAGKTTLTRMLEGSSLARFKYLYMGIHIQASNIALPTSRLVERLRPQRDHVGAPHVSPLPRSLPHHPGGSGRRGRGLRNAARLANRLADEWFRQLVSWWFQLRGYLVLYDRHFVFDFAPEISAGAADSLDRRVHRWCLMHFYPRPDLVLYLDAPGTVLFARKGESTVAELERRRQAFLRIGEQLPGFVRIDATRPLAEVYADVARHVRRLCGDAPQRPPVHEVAS